MIRTTEFEDIEAFRQTVLAQIRQDDAGERELSQKLQNTNDAEDIFLSAHLLYEKRLKEIECMGCADCLDYVRKVKE